MQHGLPAKKQAASTASDAREKRQVVAGFIIFRKTEEGMKFLFLYRRGGYWNFPKGHFEAGEDAMRTAFRETREETGIRPEDLRIVPNFKTLVRFHFFHGNEKIHDTVILYLAESREDRVVISPREHSGFAWFTYHDAMKVLGRYVGTKRALTEAYNFLNPRTRTAPNPHATPSGASPRRFSNPRATPRPHSPHPPRYEKKENHTKSSENNWHR